MKSMYAKSKHSQFKKTSAGESGLSESVPLHMPGAVNSDPAGAYYMTYQEQIKSPQWQKKRLEILDTNNYTCQICGGSEKTLHVHHIIYEKGKMMWDYDEFDLLCLCSDCHKKWHDEMNRIAYRIAYLLTNFNSPFELSDVKYLLDLYEFEPDKVNKLVKIAKNYKYPWNE